VSGKYNCNHTVKEITEVLTDFKKCVSNDRFIISQNENRQKNVDFINKFILTYKKQKKMLLNLCVNDFCYTMINSNPKFPAATLYVFAPIVKLNNIDGYEESVQVYIKFILNNYAKAENTLLISFHQSESMCKHLFV
jgi:hypothetical protein